MANYTSIHTGAEIDAAISQIQILDDSLRGASVSVSVSTLGSATPADPLNDPFDTVTNAVKWVAENYGLVDYLYIEVAAGTYVEGGLHYNPAQLPFTWQVPSNIAHVDIWGLDVTTTTLNFGSRSIKDGDSTSRLSFSGIKVIGFQLYIRNGMESYDSFHFVTTSTSSFNSSTIKGNILWYGDVTIEHGGGTNVSYPVLKILDAIADFSNVDNLNIDASNDPASGRLIYIQNSLVNLSGATIANLSANSMDVYVGPGSTLIEPATLTNCTVSFDNESIPTRAQAALL